MFSSLLFLTFIFLLSRRRKQLASPDESKFSDSSVSTVRSFNDDEMSPKKKREKTSKIRKRLKQEMKSSKSARLIDGSRSVLEPGLVNNQMRGFSFDKSSGIFNQLTSNDSISLCGDDKNVSSDFDSLSLPDVRPCSVIGTSEFSRNLQNKSNHGKLLSRVGKAGGKNAIKLELDRVSKSLADEDPSVLLYSSPSDISGMLGLGKTKSFRALNDSIMAVKSRQKLSRKELLKRDASNKIQNDISTMKDERILDRIESRRSVASKERFRSASRSGGDDLSVSSSSTSGSMLSSRRNPDTRSSFGSSDDEMSIHLSQSSRSGSWDSSAENLPPYSHHPSNYRSKNSMDDLDPIMAFLRSDRGGEEEKSDSLMTSRRRSQSVQRSLPDYQMMHENHRPMSQNGDVYMRYSGIGYNEYPHDDMINSRFNNSRRQQYQSGFHGNMGEISPARQHMGLAGYLRSQTGSTSNEVEFMNTTGQGVRKFGYSQPSVSKGSAGRRGAPLAEDFRYGEVYNPGNVIQRRESHEDMSGNSLQPATNSRNSCSEIYGDPRSWQADDSGLAFGSPHGQINQRLHSNQSVPFHDRDSAHQSHFKRSEQGLQHTMQFNTHAPLPNRSRPLHRSRPPQQMNQRGRSHSVDVSVMKADPSQRADVRPRSLIRTHSRREDEQADEPIECVMNKYLFKV